MQKQIVTNSLQIILSCTVAVFFAISVPHSAHAHDCRDHLEATAGDRSAQQFLAALAAEGFELHLNPQVAAEAEPYFLLPDGTKQVIHSVYFEIVKGALQAQQDQVQASHFRCEEAKGPPSAALGRLAKMKGFFLEVKWNGMKYIRRYGASWMALYFAVEAIEHTLPIGVPLCAGVQAFMTIYVGEVTFACKILATPGYSNGTILDRWRMATGNFRLSRRYSAGLWRTFISALLLPLMKERATNYSGLVLPEEIKRKQQAPAENQLEKVLAESAFWYARQDPMQFASPRGAEAEGETLSLPYEEKVLPLLLAHLTDIRRPTAERHLEAEKFSEFYFFLIELMRQVVRDSWRDHKFAQKEVERLLLDVDQLNFRLRQVLRVLALETRESASAEAEAAKTTAVLGALQYYNAVVLSTIQLAGSADPGSITIGEIAALRERARLALRESRPLYNGHWTACEYLL